MSSPVALVFCPGYDEEEVEKAVRQGFALFGGPGALCPGAKSVLLKPNLLVGEAPERAVTTHPAVFRAVAKVFLEAGYRVGFGDSPAFGSPESVAKKAGILEVARTLGVDFADFTHGVEVDFPEGVQHRKFTIARGVEGVRRPCEPSKVENPWTYQGHRSGEEPAWVRSRGAERGVPLSYS